MAYDEDYYKKLQEEDYSALLKSEMQLEAARQRALKNTQASLDSMGMGSSGFGSTARAGIEGQYTQGLQSAQDRYANAVKEHKEEYNEFKTSELEDYISNLNLYQGDNEAMYNRLAADGYGTYENGQWTWNEEKLAGMNPADVSMLKQGITGLDYSNNQVTQGYVSDYLMGGVEDLDPEDQNYAYNLLKLFEYAGVITEDPETHLRELHLDKLSPADRYKAQQLVTDNKLLDSTAVNGDAKYTASENSNAYFAQAEKISDTSSTEYKNNMSLGWSYGLNNAYTVKNLGTGRKWDDIWITIDNGKKHHVQCGNPASGAVSKALNDIYADAEKGTIVIYDDKLYVKTKNKGWVEVIENGVGTSSSSTSHEVDAIIEEIKNYVGYKPGELQSVEAQQPTETPTEQPTETPTEQPTETPTTEPEVTPEPEPQPEPTTDTSDIDLATEYKNALENHYHVQGLLTGVFGGRKNDDIDVTIGNNKANRKSNFDLQCGNDASSEVDEKLRSIYGQSPKHGTLAVYKDKLYVYVDSMRKHRWVEVKSDRDKVEDAIKAITDYKDLKVLPSGQKGEYYFNEADKMEDKTSREYLIALGQGYYEALKNANYYVNLPVFVGGKNIGITLGSKYRDKKNEYDLRLGKAAGKTLQYVLDKIAPEAKQGQLLIYNGKLYAKTGNFSLGADKPREASGSNNWVQVKSSSSADIEDVIEQLQTTAGRSEPISEDEQKERDLASSYVSALTDKSYIQGMGSTVRSGNDIDITIGSNKRDRKNEFDLRMGKAIKDSSLRHVLEKLVPDAKKGQLIVYRGKLYLCTGRKNKNKRWTEVKSDRSKVDDAIEAIKQLGGN